MKKKILLLASLFVITNQNVFANDEHHHHHMNMEGTKASTNSVYVQNDLWKNQDNKTVVLSDFKGKFLIATMLYTSCQKSCPIIMSSLKSIETKLTNEEREKVNFVIISLNPEKDTPDVLKKFLVKHKVTNKNWTLLNGKSSSVLKISSLFGIRFRKVADDDIIHTNKILILNDLGEIVSQQEDLNNLQTVVDELKKQVSK
jgi:protein SCO1/2